MTNEVPADEQFDALRTAWNITIPDRTNSSDEMSRSMLIHELHQLKAKQAATIRKRDLMEGAAAVLVGFFFLPNVLFADNLNLRIGSGFCVAGALIVVIVMWLGRRKLAEADLAATPYEACQLQLVALQRQKRLLEWVPLWYISPLGVGVVWIAISMMSGWFLYSYLGFCGLFFVWVGWLNRRAAVRHMQPEIDALKQIVAELTEHAATSIGTGECN